jgi:hypothetical protein
MRFENSGGVGTGIKVDTGATGHPPTIIGPYFAGLSASFAGLAPSIAVVNAGIASGATVAGTQTSGRVTFSTNATPPGAGADLLTVAFACPFANRPIVMVVQSSGQLAGVGTYLVDTSNFHIVALGTLAANTPYTVDYIVLGDATQLGV